MIIFEEEETKPSIYDPRTMRSSFYDDVKFVDNRIYGTSTKFNEQAERERIRKFLNEPYQDDWDD